MAVTKIYAARHGQTELNAENRVCGAIDLPLTEHGIQQAYELAENVQDKGIEVIYCSDMQRAVTTAETVGKLLGIKPISDPRLREMNFGSLEECMRNDIEFNRRKQVFAERFPDGGESILEGAARVYSFLGEILPQNIGKTILIVSHGWTNKFIATYFRDLSNQEFADFGLQNCGYAEYTIEN